MLLIKKVTKFIDELTLREDLREQALRVLPDDIDFGDIDEDGNAYDDGAAQPEPYYNFKSAGLKNPMHKGRNMTKNPYPVAGGERLNTIEEEDKQFDTTSNIYKTNERTAQNSSSAIANYRNAPLGKDMMSQDKAKQSSPDSRRRLDDSDDDRRVKSNQDSADEDLDDNYPDNDSN